MSVTSCQGTPTPRPAEGPFHVWFLVCIGRFELVCGLWGAASGTKVHLVIFVMLLPCLCHSVAAVTCFVSRSKAVVGAL